MSNELIVFEATRKLLQTDEAWKAIEQISGISSGNVREVVLMNHGRHNKRSFYVSIGNKTQDIIVVAKQYKLCRKPRFQRETEPRMNMSCSSFGPRFVGTSEHVSKSEQNQKFVSDEHLVLFEEHIDGNDLIDLREHPERFSAELDRCTQQYFNADDSLRNGFGRTFTNINPRNIRIPHDNEREPVIVDWGGQSKNTHLFNVRSQVAKNLKKARPR